MPGELYLPGVEDEHGPHRRCTGRVTGSDDDLVDCRMRATRVIWDASRSAAFACDDPKHIGNATHVQPIGEFFDYVRVSALAEAAEHALADCVEDS